MPLLKHLVPSALLAWTLSCQAGESNQPSDKALIDAANLFNYTVESLAHITTDSRPESCLNQIDLILNEYKVESCPDENLRQNYINLLGKLGKIKARGELADFEKRISSKRLEVELLKIDGDMMGVFAFHQDPLGLSIGTHGVSWSPGAMLGQAGSLYYLREAKAAQRQAEHLKSEIEKLTNDFTRAQASWTDLHEVRVDFFKAQGDYAKAYPGIHKHLLSNKQIEALLDTQAQTMSDELRVKRLNELEDDFKNYPPFYILRASALTRLFLKTRNEDCKQKALLDLGHYEQSPVTIYRKDPHRLTLLQCKVLLAKSETESLPLLDEIKRNHICYAGDIRLHRFLIDHYCKFHRLDEAKSVADSMRRFDPAGNDTVRASIENTCLKINAETAYQKSTKECRSLFDKIYAGETTNWEDVISLRKQSGDDRRFLDLIAPLFYHHFALTQSKDSVEQAPVSWNESYYNNNLYYTLYFSIPIPQVSNATLLYTRYNADGVYLLESKHPIAKTTRLHFTSAVLPMRDLFVTNITQKFTLILKTPLGMDLLGIEFEFDPRTNPFGYRLTRLISGQETLDLIASPQKPSVRI